MADDCRITKRQAERQEAMTLQALERAEQSGTNAKLAQLTAQAHASIQGLNRRRKPRPSRKR